MKNLFLNRHPWLLITAELHDENLVAEVKVHYELCLPYDDQFNDIPERAELTETQLAEVMREGPIVLVTMLMKWDRCINWYWEHPHASHTCGDDGADAFAEAIVEAKKLGNQMLADAGTLLDD